jgi:hypothetical protein
MPNSASTETISLLEEVAEFLEGQADVRDGSDGPRPNRAMSLMSEVELTIERLKRDSRLGPARQSAEIKFCPACDKDWSDATSEKA